MIFLNEKTVIIHRQAVILSACGLASTPIPPTATPEPPGICGTLTGSEGAIIGAEITLETYQDEACVNLAEAKDLSESERQQLDDCSGVYAMTTSDAEGQYRFSEVSPGWYKLTFTWDLSQKPDSPFPFEVRNGFLIAYYEINTTPISYSALALGDIFKFAGEEDLIINFNYGK